MSIREKIVEQGICVLIPTYNNEESLASVLDDIFKITDNIIIVNDGSTDSTASILDRYEVHVVSYSPNKGKGHALKLGFREALKMGCRYAISIDSDGQHRASDLGAFVEAIIAQPDTLIVGSRKMDQENVPGKSSFGNKFSSFWFKINTGIKLPDTQSGYRSYPIEKLSNINWWTNRFEFEVEILVRAVWNDIHVWSIPIDVYYPPADERISHFRTVRDFTRISILNTLFVIIAVFYARPLLFFKKIRDKSFKQIIKEYVFDVEDSNEKIALSVLLGSFIGLTPLIGYHIILAIFFATFLKLNKAVALVAVNISFPPFLPFIMYAGYRVGGLFIKSANSFRFDSNFNLSMIRDNAVQYLLGSMILAVIGSLILTGIVYSILLIFRKK